MSIMTEFLAMVVLFAIVAVSLASPVKQYLPDHLAQPILKCSHPIQNAENSSENTKTQSREVEVCSTEDCHEIVQMYAGAMDRDVDPCQNFYDFVCGDWTANTRKFNDNQPSDRFQIVRSSVHKRLRGMLERAPEESDILPVEQAKVFYKSCIDTDDQMARGIRTIAAILERTGGWPIAMNFEDWKEDTHSWQEVDENLARFTGYYTFYEIIPWSSLSEDSAENSILLKTPHDDLLEFRENYELFQKKIQPIVETFIAHNQANVSAEQLKKDLHDLFIFEKKLMEVTKPEDLRQLHVMKLETWILDWNYKSRAESNPKTVVNWYKMIQRMFDAEGIEIDDHWHVMAAGPYFWSLIEIWNATDERTIINYIHLHFVSQILEYLYEEPSLRLPRWLQCIQETRMHHALAYLLVENYFGAATQESAQKILKNVLEELKYRMGNLEIDDHSKSVVEEKFEKTVISLGFPDLYRNRTAIERIYEGLTIGDDYVTNILNFWKYKNNQEVRSFIEGETHSIWAIRLLISEILYTPYVMDWDVDSEDDKTSFFKAPYFTPEVPEYVKYATIGFSIGRELGENLNAVEMTTKVNGTSETLNISNMFYDQYNNTCCERDRSYNYIRGSVMTIQAWHRDMVDKIGLQLSLGAYKRRRQNLEEKSNGEMKLPGLEEFTDDQMFFIVSAGGFCRYKSSIFMSHEAHKHSLPEFQVDNCVYRTPEFAEAFHCSSGSPMNPVNKSSIQPE